MKTGVSYIQLRALANQWGFEIDCDNDGQLILYTGLRRESGRDELVPVSASHVFHDVRTASAHEEP